MKVLFIGSNPSKNNIDPKIPFKGTRSETILKQWLDKMDIIDYEFINVFDAVTDNNRPLTRKEIRECIHSLGDKIVSIRYDKIVALGNTASEALKLLKLSHYKLDHPSPRNRKLNSKEYVDKQLELCKIYVFSKGET